MTGISARIIADSKSPQGHRLTTFVVTFPRIVLSEFNTHRALSKNSASSRAIPFKRMLEMVKTNPFIPMKWMKEHTGMQGVEYFDGALMADRQFIRAGENWDNNATLLRTRWLEARDAAVKSAKELSEIGVTKQICNRLLEPFMYHTVIVTGTEWENFFALRAHPQAEIHIAHLAQLMLDVYNESTPKELKAGEWHIPFGDQFDTQRVKEAIAAQKGIDPLFVTQHSQAYQLTLVKIATARCARVSYLNFEGKDDYEADIKLHDVLLASGHMSPFEHCAKAMTNDEFDLYVSGKLKEVEKTVEGEWYVAEEAPYEATGWCGNFRGWIQYRKLIPGENKTDPRVIKK